MWKVNPALMCQKHLLGEHGEMHMFVGSINAGISLRGYIDGSLVETHNIRARHTALVFEMLQRGLSHKSPLPDFDVPMAGEIDPLFSFQELIKRCPACSKRFQKLLASSTLLP